MAKGPESKNNGEIGFPEQNPEKTFLFLKNCPKRTKKKSSAEVYQDNMAAFELEDLSRPYRWDQKDVELAQEGYYVRGIVGAGGSGVVKAAIDRETGEFCAIKHAIEEGVSSEELREARTRIHREACTGDFISGTEDEVCERRILGVNDYGNDYLVMDLVNGKNLAQIVESRKRENNKLWRDKDHIREMNLYLIQAAEALQYLHKKPRPITHRDIKPENIMVENGEILLTDLGNALPTNPRASSARPKSAEIACTPPFASREQAHFLITGNGRRDIGPPSDIQSLGGLTMYYLLTGDFLAKGDSLMQVLEYISEGKYITSRLPEPYRSIAKVCLHPEPKSRPLAESLKYSLLGSASEIDTPREEIIHSTIQLDQDDWREIKYCARDFGDKNGKENRVFRDMTLKGLKIAGYDE